MGKIAIDTASAPSCEFRALPSQHSAGNHSTSRKEETCSIFQPLFQCTVAGNGASKNKDAKDPDALLEEAQKKGFHKGLEIGRQEACDIVRDSFAPGLRAFIRGYDALAAQGANIAEHASTNVLALAQVIAECIIGVPTSMASQELSQFRTLIQEAMVYANRFDMNLHPDDICELQGILATENTPWPNHPEISIKGNPSVRNGEVRVEESSGQRQLLDTQARQALAGILANAAKDNR